MFGLGTTELIVIGVIILFLFGAKRLPEIGKGLGGAIREFRNVKKELSSPLLENDTKKPDKKDETQESPSIESKLGKKVLKRVPGVKKVMDINEKVNKVKDIIK
jgi:sec-independent protein translocase protein TatA